MVKRAPLVFGRGAGSVMCEQREKEKNEGKKPTKGTDYTVLYYITQSRVYMWYTRRYKA